MAVEGYLGSTFFDLLYGFLLNSVLPDGDKYVAKSTAQDRDVHNLLDQTESTLVLDDEFLRKGETILAELGVPSGAKFVYAS